MEGTNTGNWGNEEGMAVRLEARQERRLIRRGGSRRHVDFQLRVAEAPPRKERGPLNLAFVVDRSGSMQGEKIVTAKRAALAAIDRLEDRDRAAVVVFDDRVEVVVPAAPVTPRFKSRARSALNEVEARARTALHRGWLTGCEAIAPERLNGGGGLARCFLLTDGLANVGLTDPEAIAAQAAGVRENAGVATSTFGIGADYDEGLLGPMAVAGGGQFHHLRTAADISATFLGELAELGAVVASAVQVEVELPEGVHPDLVSPFWSRGEGQRWTVAVGDLLGGEEHHVVVRFTLPPMALLPGVTMRARAAWTSEGRRVEGEWQEIRFAYADDSACDAEERDPAVMHWVGLHHADRAEREANQASKRGDLHGARQIVSSVRAHLRTYAATDADLQNALVNLERVEHEVAEAPMPSLLAKEAFYRTQLRSRGQKDYRAPQPPDGPHKTGPK